MKVIILMLALSVGQMGICQNKKPVAQDGSNFYLDYAIAGLGSNLGDVQPTLRIRNNRFTYTREQNSYKVKPDKKAEPISKGFFRQGSIDSILALTHTLKGSTIYKANPCISSGAIVYICIAHGTDTTKFALINTFDLTSLKIIDIVNSYLPRDKQLYGSKEDIKKEEDCVTSLRNKVRQLGKDSTKADQ
jgi:hypothetical protein